jgi:hypothetical protein
MIIVFEWLAVLLLVVLPALLLLALVGHAMRFGWWPSLLWQLPYRPVLIGTTLIVLIAATFLVLMECCWLDDAMLIGFAVWLFAAPLIALPATAALAWWMDAKALRADAASIRNQRHETWGEVRRVSAGRPWREYILDVQRARLRARYQPPD